MSSAIKYRFPDAETLHRSIEMSSAWIDKGIQRTFILDRIKKLATLHLAGKEVDERELDTRIISLFSNETIISIFLNETRMPILTLNFINNEGINQIKSDLININGEFFNRIKSALIHAAIFPLKDKIERYSIEAVRLLANIDYSTSDLYIAAEYGFIDDVKEIIKKDPRSILSKSPTGITPLQVACFKGNSAVVNLLLEAGASLQEGDNQGLKALDYAVCAKLSTPDDKRLIVEEILKKSAALNLTIKDISKSHLLFEEAARARPEFGVFKLLLDYGVEIEYQGYDTLKALIKFGHNEIVQFLLDRGVPVDPKEKGEQSALFVAAFCGHRDVFFTLLNKGADVNWQDSKGVTALHVASSKGNLEFVKALVKKDAKMHLEDLNGGRAIHYAMLEEKWNVVEFLHDWESSFPSAASDFPSAASAANPLLESDVSPYKP